MDVRIGITDTPKEISVEFPDDSDNAGVREAVEEALSGKREVLWLTDRKGRSVAVPSTKIAYIEIVSDSADRRIGFVS